MKFLIWGCISLISYCQASLLFPPPNEQIKQSNNWRASDVETGDGKEIREAIFTQWVDHENHIDGGTFDQYVFINDEYYQPGGPVLIFVSAESDMYTYWLQNSHMTNIVYELGGVIYALEPRYFDRSYPTSDVSLENLEQYLQLNQTMADYVDFITYLRRELINYDTDKFILIGHGRGGTLATWIHQRYPGIADGVWSASSPISTLFDFGWYYSEMLEIIDREFPVPCQQTINEAFNELDVLINNGDINTIRDIFIFNSELDLTNRDDVALFYRKLFELLFSPIEYGTLSTITLMCNAMESSEDYSSLELLGLFYGTALNDQVFDYVGLVTLLKEESLEAEAVVSHERQNLYIRCTGWATFKTSSQLVYPNNRFPADIFGGICEEVFGISYNEAIENSVRVSRENQFQENNQNIYFTNAQFDPHHVIGQKEDVSSTVVADFIPRIGKLFDFFRFVYIDAVSEELYAVRDRAEELITLWSSRNF